MAGMTDRFRPLGMHRLADWIVRELDASDSIFGIPRGLFFDPQPAHRFTLDWHGRRLETPIGVAAGPHTQLAQNIIVAWLCGARVIELKTVQTLDAIDVAKPCIDMRDAGTNTEWSQELRVEESFRQYLAAWVLIHALHRRLGFPGEQPGVAFDLSVGYDLAGLEQPNMRAFLERTGDAGNELDRAVEVVARRIPEAREIEIPERIADSVTLSTLHGCPPEEIGAIAEHLLDTWGLHTAVKLNPTLLGYDTVREVLVDRLGWREVEPQRSAFDQDIGYADALALIGRLRRRAEFEGLDFGVKLCNTLPIVNRGGTLGGSDDTAYLSGRPLHALAVGLAHRLRTDAGPGLEISFAGGADAFNTPGLLAAGLRPVTVCSDLLRPGGYLRLAQYIDEIDGTLDATGSDDLDELARTMAAGATLSESFAANLADAVDRLRRDPEVRAATYRRDHTKTQRILGLFDCVVAPCTDACSIDQQVPAYLRAVAAGELDRALSIIDEDNPLPTVLGRACHHPCEEVCSRTHLDRPVAIREIKRFVTDTATIRTSRFVPGVARPRVAVIGAGPCGLAAARELGRAGIPTTVFEAGERGGGMVSATIPGYRASHAAVQRDLTELASAGVVVEYGVRAGVHVTLDELFSRGFDDIVVATGAHQGMPLAIAGADSIGVLDGLDFLRLARRGAAPGLGARVAVVGGGDVAMDCARTARRLTAGSVEILYRRTSAEMPAHPEELADLRAEGIGIRELLSPSRIISSGGRLRALECAVMQLGGPDASGRPRPEPVSGDGPCIELDSLIIAIGQRADLSVFAGLEVACTQAGYVAVDPETLESSVPRVFVGGDLRHPGPTNIVDACGDGRRIARAILGRHGINTGRRSEPTARTAPDRTDLLRRRGRRQPRVEVPRRTSPVESSFAEIVQTLDPARATAEAARCLDCDLMCSTCETVCPNRAIVGYFFDSSKTPDSAVDVEQVPQVAVLADLCNECGNCVAFCPASGSPWRDKPRLYLDREDFENEHDNAFMLFEVDGRRIIQGRFDGELHQLVDHGELRYDGPAVSARFTPAFRLIETGGTGDAGPPEAAAVLLVLLRGVAASLPQVLSTAADSTWVISGS
jgi:putative selenate reductase